MVFSSPSWVPSVSRRIPSSVPVGEFVLNEAPAESRAPFVDGLNGLTYTAEELRSRVDNLARGMARELGWSPNKASPWDKVVGIYSLNMVDYFVLCWAVHRLNGICLPIHSTTSPEEMASHMAQSQCRTLFTCQGLMTRAENVAKLLSIPLDRIYTMTLPQTPSHQQERQQEQQPAPGRRFKTLEDLVTQGQALEPLDALDWKDGQGKTQVAFLCSTSGTSGRQKLAMLTHYGIITNVMQTAAFEGFDEQHRSRVTTAAAPFSHSYGLLVGHLAVLRADTLIIFPSFDIQMMLGAIPQHRIERLWLVPSILAALAAHPSLLDMYDVSSVRDIVTGAAPLDQGLADRLHAVQPQWRFLHAYGLTESCIVATLTSVHDIWHGSSGSLLPGFALRLVGPNGRDVEAHGEVGEILFKSSNLFVGYLGDHEATCQALDAQGWLHTGDVGEMRVGPLGTEHLFIRDRLKDVIKVKGIQIMPADIEVILYTHPAVVEAAVIGLPDELAGERPGAFVVRSGSVLTELSNDELRESINDHMQDRVGETHWLHHRIFYLKEIPKSENGKILKKKLKELVVVEEVEN